MHCKVCFFLQKMCGDFNLAVTAHYKTLDLVRVICHVLNTSVYAKVLHTDDEIHVQDYAVINIAAALILKSFICTVSKLMC